LEVYTKVQRRGRYVLVATCDVELLGKTLTEGKIVFDVCEKFYKGAKMTVEEAVELMKQSNIVNMIGHCVVEKAIREGLVHPEAILKISGVPHAQIVRF
jgi:hypothetical protein